MDPKPEQVREIKEVPEPERSAEKRRAYRTPLVCPTSCQALKGDTPSGQPLPATTADISPQGALLRIGQPLMLGSRHELHIQIPGVRSTMDATARVVRIEEEEPAQRYLVGFVFERAGPAEAVDFLSRLQSMDLRQILDTLLSQKGSDLHLTTAHPPIARIRGRLVKLNRPPFRENEIRALLYSIMTQAQVEAFEHNRELDFAYSMNAEKRFRFNVHWQRGLVEAAVRVIPSQVPQWETLGIPPVVVEWIRKPNGLILIVGPNNSGKTTTLNSLVEQINQERDAVIICLERPIEYIHKDIKSVIKQREVGSDTLSFAEAVRRAMRQDPDVIVVGEVEDAETVQVVLNAAETGNLVLASLHATNTIQAIDRFISLCPPQQRAQICFQLASCLQGVLAQYLLPREQAMGAGFALATEVLVATDAGRNHLRTNNLAQLHTVIETGATYKMHTFDRSIRQLLNQGMIAKEAADQYLALSSAKV